MPVHPTAIVEDGARLGADVTVGPNVYIESGASIGDGCRIGPNAVVYRHVTLGPRCTVHAGAVLGDLPQDLGFQGGESFVEIGADCTIREGVTIHRGTKPGTCTKVGERCFLMAFSHLGHNVTLGTKVILANDVLLAGYVEVGEGAFIAGNVGVHQFCRVGRLAMLGGACGISQDVPPFCTTRPVALNNLVGLNAVGLRRAGMSAEARQDLKEAFRLYFRSGLNGSQALQQIREKFPSGPAAEFCDFIAASKRGICGGAGMDAD